MSEWKKYIEYIQKNARVNGAYLASDRYLPYKKVWLRDHAITSYLLMEMGYDIKEEINWLCDILGREHEKIKGVLKIPRNTKEFYDNRRHPAARYTPSFERINEDWNERQYDGIALSVLLLLEYFKRSGKRPPGFVEDYLKYLFYVHGTPCASLWEMHNDHLHAYTIGLIAFTMKKAALFYPEYRDKYQYVLEFFISRFLVDNALKAMMKVRRYGTCASSLLLLDRFDIFPKDRSLKDHIFNNISRKLSPDGIGLYRYIIDEIGEKDTYFGGNLWYITTYWRANYLISKKKLAGIEDVLNWYNEFPLGEQIYETKFIISMEKYNEWRIKSMKENNGVPGPAKPLTWSMIERAYLEYKLENI